MDNTNPNPAAQPLPWYDDRVEAVRKEYVNPWAEEDEPAEPAPVTGDPARYTPREIYACLDRLVWKQDEAKRAASVIMYVALSFSAYEVGSNVGVTCYLAAVQFVENDPWKKPISVTDFFDVND